jgi:hypothetical protein
MPTTQMRANAITIFVRIATHLRYCCVCVLSWYFAKLVSMLSRAPIPYTLSHAHTHSVLRSLSRDNSFYVRIARDIDFSDQSLCNRDAIPLKSLCDSFRIALESLYNRFTIAFAIALKPINNRFAIPLKSLCSRYVIPLKSPYNRDAIAMRLL